MPEQQTQCFGQTSQQILLGPGTNVPSATEAAKSNAIQTPTNVIPPDYPFQQLCCDCFSYNNYDYAVIVDRYSSWLMVFRSHTGAVGLVKCLRETFVTFGVTKVLHLMVDPSVQQGKPKNC